MPSATDQRYQTRRVWPLLSLVLLLAACGGGITAAGRAGATGPSGTVVFAQLDGSPPTYILPLFSGSAYFVNDQGWFEDLMWRPLYWFGYRGGPGFNPDVSVALPPRFTRDRGRTVATITLKPYRWSDGRPVTTRDVAFWISLLEANRAHWAPYVPGTVPDNVSAIRYLDARTFQVTFDRSYSTTWLFENELTQIIPIPQHAWDRTRAGGPVGNFARTPAGAQAVYRFLNQQAGTLPTYASNPLWQVVDGPWRLSSYDPATFAAAFVPNPRYSGPIKPRIAHLVEAPFTSATAEFDSLEAGRVDYGYVPFNDFSTIRALEAKGYRIHPWGQSDWGGLVPNYARLDPAAAILKQLYVRQAMTHLIDMSAITRVFWHGQAYYAAGPVPDPGGNSPLVTAYARHDPYPYSAAAAVGLLRRHGWRIRPGGASVCRRPGSGPGQCGVGVRGGQTLTFRLLYTAGEVTESAIVQTIQSSFTRAGIALEVRAAPGNAELAQESTCIQAARCSFDLNYVTTFWPFGEPEFYPTGESAFGCASIGNYTNWCNPTTQTLIDRAETVPGLTPLFQYEDAMARLQPVIFVPEPVYQLSAVRRGLLGTQPQDPYLAIYPETWSWAR